MSSLVVNTHYDFSLHTNSVLGSSYTGMRLASILDYKTAVKFGNVETLHRQIFPYLPPGTPKDHSRYTYYVFEKTTSSGELQIVVANEWIIQNSIVQTSGSDYTFRLKNVNSEKVAIVRDQLRLLGIQFDIL